MKALRKIRPAYGCMELVDIPEPAVTPGHVKIKVAYCGICGSDMKFYHWNMRPGLNIPIPVTLGHEYSGTVTELGEGVSGIAEGDRVVSETPEISCGKCAQCRTGNTLLCASKRSIGYQTDGAINTIVNNEICITGSYGQRYDGWERVLTLMSQGKLNADALETHTFPLEQWQNGFDTAEQSQGIKILLQP